MGRSSAIRVAATENSPEKKPLELSQSPAAEKTQLPSSPN